MSTCLQAPLTVSMTAAFTVGRVVSAQDHQVRHVGRLSFHALTKLAHEKEGEGVGRELQDAFEQEVDGPHHNL